MYHELKQYLVHSNYQSKNEDFNALLKILEQIVNGSPSETWHFVSSYRARHVAGTSNILEAEGSLPFHSL
jgi:hypothetical protein